MTQGTIVCSYMFSIFFPTSLCGVLVLGLHSRLLLLPLPSSSTSSTSHTTLLTHLVNLSSHNNLLTHNSTHTQLYTHNSTHTTLLPPRLVHTTCHHTTCHHTTGSHMDRHLVTWIITLRGRRGMALGWLWWRAWVPVDAVDAAAFGVAGRGTW